MKFRFRAKQGPREHREGEIEAPNERLAVNKILEQGLIPIDIKPIHFSSKSVSHPSTKSFLNRFKSFQDEFFQTDVVLFTRVLSDFLNAGIPVLRSLQLVRKYFPSGRMALSLVQIEEDVRKGSALSTALQRFPHIFSKMYINMIQAGEISGSLQETTLRLSDFLEKDQDSRFKVVSSLVYPFIILCVGLVTLFVLLTWVIPRIMVVFEEMDQKIPLITKALMGVSAFFSNFWWLILIGVSLVVMLFMKMMKKEEGRQQFDRTIFLTPGLGRFIRDVSVARFARTLGSLLQGGVAMMPAVGYASNVVSNHYIQKELQGVTAYISEGMPLSQALAQGEIFLDADISMLSVGEETGDLALGLFKLASFYEKDTDRRMGVITTMIEPALILGLGLIIGLIVLAMLMPIFEMNLAIK